MCYYILLFYLDVITHPCPSHDVGLAIFDTYSGSWYNVISKTNLATEISYHQILAWGQVILIVSMNTYLRLWKQNTELAHSVHDLYLTCSQYGYELPTKLYVCDSPPADLNQFSRHVVAIWQKYKYQIIFIHGSQQSARRKFQNFSRTFPGPLLHFPGPFFGSAATFSAENIHSNHVFYMFSKAHNHMGKMSNVCWINGDCVQSCAAIIRCLACFFMNDTPNIAWETNSVNSFHLNKFTPAIIFQQIPSYSIILYTSSL